MSLLRTLIHRLDNDGVRSLAWKVLRRVRDTLRRRPAPAARPAGAPGFRHPFDLAHGTDTSGFIAGADLSGDSQRRAHAAFYATAYYAVAPSTLRLALGYLPVTPEELAGYTFVDLGCGKGRALLVAAELPFGAVLGVDLSSRLCEIARANTAADARVTVLEQDAATLEYPQTGLVLFLYHPFLAPVLKRVLAGLEEQLRARPRPVFLLYANPTYARILARYPFLEQVWDYGFKLSDEDAAADRHGMTRDHYTLYRAVNRTGAAV